MAGSVPDPKNLPLNTSRLWFTGGSHGLEIQRLRVQIFLEPTCVGPIPEQEANSKLGIDCFTLLCILVFSLLVLFTIAGAANKTVRGFEY